MNMNKKTIIVSLFAYVASIPMFSQTSSTLPTPLTNGAKCVGMSFWMW